MQKNLIISAGGTGGHIFPALAVARALESQYNIIWVGGKTGLENTIVPANNIQLYTVSILGVRNKGILRKLLLPIMLLKALFECIQIIRKVKPEVVIGFGGYAAFPICLSAKLLAKKVVVHEQNSVIGLTNKVIAKFADLVITAFPGVYAANKVKMLGNPVRQEITQSYNQNKLTNIKQLRILIVGGSLGAQVFNDIIPEALALIKDNIYSVTHQVGRGNKELVEIKYQENQLKNVSVVNFIDDMAKAFSEHDLIICRSGASTVAEVACAGIVPIFIPYPHAVDDHQTTNAKYLVDNNAGYLLPQTKFTKESLSMLIQNITNNDLANMMHKLHQLALVNSTQNIAAEIARLVK